MNWIWLALGGAIIVAAVYYLAPKGWRTMTFNAACAGIWAALEALSAFAGLPWREVLPMAYVPFVGFAFAAVNILLRWHTTGPVGEK